MTDDLDNLLRKALQTVSSAYTLLEAAQNSTEADRKAYILDSFQVSKSTKEYKEWEKTKTEHAQEVSRLYNKVIGEMMRISKRKEDLLHEYEELKTLGGGITLPSWKVSKEAIVQLNDPILLKNIDKLPRVVPLDQLYSVDSDELPFPDLEQFKKLVAIDLRLKVELKMKHDILVHMRNQILADHRKWSSREQELMAFFDEQLPAIIKNVEDIKKTEYEVEDEEEDEEEDDDERDGKYGDDDEDDDMHDVHDVQGKYHGQDTDIKDLPAVYSGREELVRVDDDQNMMID